MEISEIKLISLGVPQAAAQEFSGRFIFKRRIDPTAEHSLLVIEPFTWAWFAITIIEGVIAAIGAKLFNDLFNANTGGKVDFVEFQRQLLIAIGQIVRAILLEDNIRQIEGQLKSLNTLMLIYNNNPRDDMLSTLIVNTTSVVEDADSMGVPAVATFGIVGSLQLLQLQERYKVSKVSGDRKSVCDVAGILIDKIPGFTERLVTWNESRFSPVINDSGSELIPARFYVVDGQEVRTFSDLAKAQAQRAAHVERERQRLDNEILSPLYAVGSKWSEVKKQFG